MSFAFLAHPPPQKQRPLYSPPSIPQQPVQPAAPTTPTSPRPANRPRSSTTSAIAAWVAQIQPGTPTLSPHRQASFSRRPSVTGSFLSLIDTPTTAASAARTPGSLRDFKGSLLDLTAQGYASVFVQLPVPKTPDSPPAPNRTHIIPLNLPIPPIPTTPTRGPKKTKSLSRLRSLSFKSAAAMLAPKKHKDDTAKASSSSKSKSSDNNHNSSGKARYGHIVRPMTLANEVQLMQLLDGGSVNSNVKRVMEAQARAAGMQPGAIGGGVSDAYRDGRGGLWRDQDEEWEFATLIDAKGRGTQPRQRHQQQPQPSPKGLPGKLKTLGLGKSTSTNKSAAPSSPKATDEWVDFSDDEDDERRGSLSSSLSSAVDAYDDLSAFGGALGGGPRRPGSSVLNAPKSHRAKPVFSHDPFAPKAPASTSSRGTMSSVKEGETERKKGSARRRPEPITLPPPSPRSSSQRPSNSPVPAPAAVDARRAFLDSSFAPDASVAASSSRSSGAPSMEAVALAVTSRAGRGPPSPEVMRGAGARMVKTKRSRMDMRGMIRGLKRD